MENKETSPSLPSKGILLKRIHKDQFIGDYITKRMKRHVFPRISKEYYSTLHKYEDAANKAWELKLKKSKI